VYIIYWCKYLADDIVKIIDSGNIKQSFIDMSLRAYPNNQKIMHSAGNAYMKAGLIDKGLEMSVLAYEGGDIPLSELYNLSKIMFDRKNYADVVSFVKSHEQMKDARIAGLLGTSLFFLERYDEAIVELEHSLRAQGSDIEKLFFLATCYIKTGKDLQALPHLERAYSLDKTNRKIIGDLVALYGRLGQTQKASDLLNSLSWRLK